MTEPDPLVAARRLADAATKPPWRWACLGSDQPVLMGTAGDENYSYETEIIEAEHDHGGACRRDCTMTVNVSDADAAWIAWLSTNGRALLDQLEAAQAKLEQPCGSCHPCVNYSGSKERNDSLVKALEASIAWLEAAQQRASQAEAERDDWKRKAIESEDASMAIAERNHLKLFAAEAALGRVRDWCDEIHGHGADTSNDEVLRLRSIIERINTAAGAAVNDPTTEEN